jgi:ribosomal protein L37E
LSNSANILNNAAMSIQVGIEDLALATPARVLSSVRNLHAGVLLLLKARLLELSPAGSDEVLLKQKIKPHLDDGGQLQFIGSGTKTVDVAEIKERLKALGSKVDWERLDKLTRERNSIEHYYAQVSFDALRGLAADVLVIVRDFTARELQRDPKALLGDKTWEQLLENKEVFDSERNECLEALRAAKWGTDALTDAVERYLCPECGSPLQRPVDPSCQLDDMVVECRSCGHQAEADEFVEQALRDGVDRHTPIRDGDRDPIGTCPQCTQDTFIVDEDLCARCGSGRTHTTCVRCGSDLDIEEQDFDGICGYCEHMTSKDD